MSRIACWGGKLDGRDKLIDSRMNNFMRFIYGMGFHKFGAKFFGAGEIVDVYFEKML